MNTTIKFPVIISALFAVLFLTACSDKVDKTLDKYEDVVSKYESKAANKTLTRDNLESMSKEIDAIDEDFELHVGKAQSDWTTSQRERATKLNERREKLDDATQE